MPRPVPRLLAAIVLAATLGGAGMLAVPGTALAGADVPVAVSPEEGAFVEPGSVELAWTVVDAPQGFEVRWATRDGGDAGTASTTATSVTIEVAGGSYAWQVRTLPGGAWSTPATFYADPELLTLAEPEQPAAVPATPALPPQGLDAIPGGVWIGGALGFSAVFLALVVIQSRIRREQDA